MESEINSVGKLASGWEKKEWKLRTLTPIWVGGFKTGECAKWVKGSGLVGSLRYWAEQACREEGNVCSGGAWCGQLDCAVCKIFGSTELSRAFRIQIIDLKYLEIKKGLFSDEFRIEIFTRKNEPRATDAHKLVDAAIRLIASNGGLGARTQHGWGQVELLSD